MTKKNAALLNNYRRANATDLYQVYGRCSQAKRNAFNHCKEVQYLLNGHNGRICSASSHFFTYAFEYEKDGEKRLHYMTGRNDYDFALA